MLETPHALMGAVIAVKIGDPFIALPLAFLSHFPLDMLPHWNPHTYTEIKTNGKLSLRSHVVIWTDVFTSLALGFWIAYQVYPDFLKMVVILAACFLAILPDLAESPYFIFGFRHPIFETLISIQRQFQNNISFIPGLSFQILFVLFLLNYIAG